MALKLNPYVLPTGSDFLRGSKIAKQNEGPFGFGSGWAGEIVGRPTAAALDVFGGTATGLGFNNAADVLHSGADYFNDRLQPLKSFDGSMDYFTSPNGLFGNFLNLTGSQLALLAPILAIPGGGIIGAGGRFLTQLPNLFRAGNYLLRAPITLARRNLGLQGILPRLSKPTADWAVRNAFSSPVEGLTEKGNYIENAIANGEDPELARQKSWDVFKNNVGFLTGTNAIEGGLASKIFRGNDWKSRLGAALAGVPVQVYEEGGQQGFQMDAEGKPYTLNPVEMLTNPQYAEQYNKMKETVAPMTLQSILGFASASIRGNRNKNSQNENPPQPSPTETPVM